MMNIRSFKYHLKEGIKSLFKNNRMSIISIASVATCIAMLIISLCLAINIDVALENLEKNIGISVFLGEDVTAEEVTELFEQIESIENISNITYKTKEDALEWAKERWGEESILLAGLDVDNPFPRSFDIEVDEAKNQELVIEKLEKIQRDFEIKLLTAIEIDNIELRISLDNFEINDDTQLEENMETSDDTQLEENTETSDDTETFEEGFLFEIDTTEIEAWINKEVIQRINSSSYKYIGIETIAHSKIEAERLLSLSTIVRIISGVLILILAIVSVIIIVNTIKVTVYVRREEINIMKYVGATDSFIRWPFIIEGILIGIIGAIIPSIICLLVYIKSAEVLNNNPYFSSIVTLKPALDLFLLIIPIALILGTLLGVIGSINSIKKHLDV